MPSSSPDPVPTAAAPTLAPAPVTPPDARADALAGPGQDGAGDVSPGPLLDAVSGSPPGVPEAHVALDAPVSLDALGAPDAAVSLAALVPLDTCFSLAGMLAMAGWVLLVVFPRSPLVTDRLVGLGLPAVIGVLYAGLILAFWAGSPGGFGSLDAVAALFSVRGLLLAGWVHYLAFDLFVGAWEVRTARAEAIPHLLVVPCLLMTFLFGPVGLLMFLVLRLLRGLSRRTVGAPA